MISIDILKIYVKGIVESIKEYTSEPTILIKCDKLIESIENNNFSIFDFCIQEVKTWYTKNISEIYNNQFVYHKDVHSDNIKKLDSILSDIQNNKEEYILQFGYKTVEIKNKDTDYRKIFIVHGRDDLSKVEVARYLEKLSIEPIILHEQVNSGDTIIEKIERYSNVQFGIILYTPCDKGSLCSSSDWKYRARQNVVFEHGYLMGKIGRKNVCALVKGDIETPNDISGVVYIQMDDKGAWILELARELKNAGFKFDFNLLL